MLRKSKPPAAASIEPRRVKGKPQTRPKLKPKSAPRETRAEKSERAAAIFARLHAIEPHPKGELEHVNPFTLLVAVVLSAQATDAGVNKATRSLFKAADTPAKMLAIGEDGVRDAIRTIGLFRTKAKNVIALSQRLIDEHGGSVPTDRDALERLPGVGRKTANVVMNMAFGQPTLAVDTHVFRAAHRLDLSRGKNPFQVETDLLRVIPSKYALHAHHWLILHGRYICKARVPECWRCPIVDLCPFKPKVLQQKSSRASAA